MYNWGMWIEDRHIWGPEVLPRSLNSPLGPPVADMTVDPYEAVADALRERGLERATIGLELRFLGVEAFRKLQRLLPEAEFREVLDLFLELRVVKSEEEIRRLRTAAQATERALAAAIETMRPGMTGLELERVIGAEHYRAGVRHEWMHTMIGPLGIDVVGPNPGQLKVGEIICLDAGGSCRHYQSDLALTVAIGEPSPDLAKIHRGMRRAMDAVLDALRPGVPAPQLFEAGNRVLEREGFESYLTYLGHGVGRNVHEEPVLALDSRWVLAEGMTLAIELSTRRLEWGAIGLEDDVVITADGHEALSTIGRRLHVVDA